MPDAEQAWENAFRAYVRHCRYWEAREGWPHIEDAVLRGRYEDLALRAGMWAAETRQAAGRLLSRERAPSICPPGLIAAPQKVIFLAAPVPKPLPFPGQRIIPDR